MVEVSTILHSLLQLKRSGDENPIFTCEMCPPKQVPWVHAVRFIPPTNNILMVVLVVAMILLEEVTKGNGG